MIKPVPVHVALEIKRTFIVFAKHQPDIMSSTPPPRAGLLKGDHVLVDGVWFEMMNSAPQCRPSAAGRSISDSSGNDGALLNEGRANTSSEIEGRSRDRSAHSHIMVEQIESKVLKPRPIQTRSTTAGSTSYSGGKLRKGQNSFENGNNLGVENCRGARNEYSSAGKGEQTYQIPKPGYHVGCSTCASTSDFCDRKGATDGNSEASGKDKAESENRGRSEYRNGHALVHGVYHEMWKPGASTPRSRNKLQKAQKGMKNRRDSSVGGGSRPRLIIP